MELRPKKEIRLLVEYAFRMVWSTNNILRTKIRMPQKTQEQAIFNICMACAALICQMLPEGNLRELSYNSKVEKVAIEFGSLYNNYVDGYLRILELRLPAPMELVKCELLAAEQIDAITDFICETYSN